MKKNLKILPIALLIAVSCQQKPQTETVAEAPKKPSLTKVWETDTLLTTAEAVILYPDSNLLFVSCINGTPPDSLDNDGFIAQISPETGEIINLKWAEGISGPKGMGITNGSLFVTNINEIVELDIATGEVRKRYPVEGANFLNDITITADGSVIISDSGTNRIHMIKNDSLSLYMESEKFKRPNGLLSMDSLLYLASSGGGDFMKINFDTKQVEVITDSIMSGDGVVSVGEDFIVSSWSGQIFYVEADGRKTLLSDTRDQGINSADIWYQEDQNLLLVPTFFANTVVAYRLEK